MTQLSDDHGPARKDSTGGSDGVVLEPPAGLTSPIWVAKPLVRAATGGAGGCWLIVADDRGLAPALAEELRATCRTVYEVYTGSSRQRLDDFRYQVRRGSRSDLDELLADLPGLLGGVVWLRTLDSTGEAVSDLTGQTHATDLLYAAQSFARHLDSPLERFVVVTSGLTLPSDGPDAGHATGALRAAAAWGLGRLLRSEKPQLSPLLVDIDPHRPPAEAAADLAHEILAGSREDEVAFRRRPADGGKVERYVQRLAEGIRGVPRDRYMGRSPGVHANATYLVTGDLAGLGADMALWLCQQGARRLCLLSRGKLTMAADAIVRVLRDAGVEIRIPSVDMADPIAVATLVSELDRPEAPLRGIFHTVRAFDSGGLGDNDGARLERMMARRARGALYLHRATRSRELDYFVVVTSFAALVGEPGQCTAAVADSFLDGLVMHRRQLGLPGLNLCLGPVGDGRVRRTLAASLAARGLGVLSSGQALDMMCNALRHGAAQAVAVAADWRRWVLRSATPWTPRYENLVRQPERRQGILRPLAPPGQPLMVDIRHTARVQEGEDEKDGEEPSAANGTRG